ncbi:MAG: RdgB/HAM1 family non-canonical purine NTP pyrophosphatase [Bryobacteraceae bacterium]
MTIYACSSNRAKLEELLLAGRKSDLPSLAIQPLPGLTQIAPPEENGASFEENATTKAEYYSRFIADLVLADDSGLEVAALNGAPGIHSARYAGLHANDAENNDLLLRRLENKDNRAARFVCAVALARAGSVCTTLRGTAEGEILMRPRGDEGFGYDPLFFYPPLGCTFAELTRDEKFAVSHRGRALRDLFTYLSERLYKSAVCSDKIT